MYKLQARNIYIAEPKGASNIDGNKTADPTKAAAFLCALENSLPHLPQFCSGQQYQYSLQDTTHSMALSVFCKMLWGSKLQLNWPWS